MQAINKICASHTEAMADEGVDLGVMPEWDLSDLYTSENTLKITADMKTVEELCVQFNQNYKDQLAKLDASGLLQAIKAYETIETIGGRLASFAGLRYYQKTTDVERGQFMANTQEKLTQFFSHVVFFDHEINQIDEETLNAMVAENADLAHYKALLSRLRAQKPYQLSPEIEQFVHDMSPVGRSAWNRLFDETIAALEFTVQGEIRNLEGTLNLLTSKDRDVRKAAAMELAKVFKANIRLFSRIHNTMSRSLSLISEKRGYPTLQSSRHIANDVEPEVVNALKKTVMDNYSNLSHRYYGIKARWMGLDKLQLWDRNAPLPESAQALIPWHEAKDIVLSAYGEFSAEFADYGKRFFDSGWIDAPVKAGKAPGAFAHPSVTTVHPYLMLNYLGKPRDVMTLAHELGHGVHQILAASQGELMASTPLTLAETASVFGEMLTFRRLLNRCHDKKQKQIMLASKVEDMLDTVVRQIAFYDFECQLHAERAKSELKPEDINRIWLKTQKASLGDGFDYFDGYEVFWAYVPHFVHTPFYVYAYAFGDGLVNALYNVYQQGDQDFVKKYFTMLRAGGTLHHSELLKPFGLDASDKAFWTFGVNTIIGLIDELESL